MITTDQLAALCAPFSREKTCVKVNSFSKDKTKALLVLYAQHTYVAERLDLVDPSWTFEAMEHVTKGDSCYVKGRLNLCGVSRDNYGDGEDYKTATSDALKRCAVLFGVGRYLYDSENVWVPYDDQRDRYKQWTIEEYEHYSRAPKAAGPSPAPKTQIPPQADPKGCPELNPGDAMATFGTKMLTHKGKRFKDIEEQGIRTMLSYLETSKRKQPLSPDAETYLQNAYRYLDTLRA